MPPSAQPDNPCVTVLARHALMPGKESIFNAWIEAVVDASSRFPGYRGCEVIRPFGPDQLEYVSLFRFDTEAHLKVWMDSEERAKFLLRVPEFSTSPPTLQAHSLEFWFSPNDPALKAPRRYKMAVVTYLTLVPLVYAVPGPLSQLTGLGEPFLQPASIALVVVLMTYLAMPLSTRLFGWWLSPS